MKFTEAGSFTRAGRVNCTVAGTSRAGAVASAGTYTTSGDTLTIGGYRSTGSVPDSFRVGRGNVFGSRGHVDDHVQRRFGRHDHSAVPTGVGARPTNGWQVAGRVTAESSESGRCRRG